MFHSNNKTSTEHRYQSPKKSLTMNDASEKQMENNAITLKDSIVTFQTPKRPSPEANYRVAWSFGLNMSFGNCFTFDQIREK